MQPPSDPAVPASPRRDILRGAPPAVPAVLVSAVTEAAELLRGDGAMAYLLEPVTGELRFACDAGIADERRRDRVRRLRLAPGEGMFGRAVAERRVVSTGDYPADTSFRHAAGPDRVVRRLAIRSMAVAPLIAGDEVAGALGVFSATRDAFDAADVALVRALADHAAAAMANARLIDDLARSREALTRRADMEQALREIAARIAELRDTPSILHLIAAEAARLLGRERVFINILDDASGDAGWTWYSPTEVGRDPWSAAESIRAGEGVTGKAMADRRTFATGDYLRDDRFVHRPGPDRYTRRLGLASAIAVPMFDGDTAIGAMLVEARERDAFDETDAAILEALARQASIALANARLIEALDGSRERLARRADGERTLRAIATRIATVRDPAELLQRVLDEAAALLRAERAQIDLTEPVDERWQWSFPVGVEPSRRPGRARRGGIATRAIELGRAVRTGDYVRDRSFRHSRSADAFIRASGLRSVIAAPVVGETGLLGVLQVGTSVTDAYDELDADLLEALAGQAAAALTTARLIVALDASRGELGRRAEAERTLREIAATVTALRDPREVISRTITAAEKLLRGDYAEIGLAVGGGPSEYAGSTSLPRPPTGAPGSPIVVPGVGVSGLAFKQRRAVRTGDYLADRRFEHGAGIDAFLVKHGIRSAISAPLVMEERAVGAMTVVSRRADAFDDEDGALLQALADQASIAIANARLIDRLEASGAALARSAEAERTLREIAARITSVRDPAVILERICAEAGRLLASDRAAIYLEARSGIGPGWTWVDASGTTTGPPSDPILPGYGVVGRALADRGPFWTDDYLRDRRFRHRRGTDRYIRQHGFRSVLAAPLVDGDDPIGALLVESRRAGAYGQVDADRLSSLAQQASIAIANARLIEQLERSGGLLARRVEREKSLRGIAAGIAALREPAEVLERIVGDVSRLLGSDGAHLTFLAEDGTHLVPAVLTGATDAATHDWIRAMRFPLVGGINGLAATTDTVVWTEDYLVDPRITPHSPADIATAERMGLRGMAAAPLRGPFGDVIGTLAVNFRAPRAFDEDELDLLQGFADFAAIAFVNSRLHEQLAASEARYRFLVDNQPDIVFSADADGTFTYISDAVERSLGRPAAEVVGQHFRVLVDPATMAVAAERYAEAAADPGREVRTPIVLVHRDGTRIPFEIVAAGFLRDGTFAGVHGSARDVSQRERLERELRRSAADVAAAQERAHLARELHDSVTQALFSMTLVTRTLEVLLERDPARAAEQLAILRDLQRDALAEMRSLIFELRPGGLEHDGLAQALRTHCAAVEGRVGVPIQLTIDDRLFDERLPIEVEDALYRITQEALHNVVKHAAATRVAVDLTRVEGRVHLTIVDDGRGFDPASVPDGHLGLTGMGARAERIGGHLEVRSRRGGGTRIEVSAPVEGRTATAVVPSLADPGPSAASAG
jgi:PAS domain S-box-containing protein